MLSLLDFRGRRYRRERAAVESAMSRGDHGAVAELARTSLARWSLNWQDGGRKSILRDVGHLDWMSSTLGNVSPDRAAEIDQLRSAIADIRAFFEDRGNFGIDGRMVKRGSADRLVALQDAVIACRMAVAGRG